MHNYERYCSSSCLVVGLSAFGRGWFIIAEAVNPWHERKLAVVARVFFAIICLPLELVFQFVPCPLFLLAENSLMSILCKITRPLTSCRAPAELTSITCTSRELLSSKLCSFHLYSCQSTNSLSSVSIFASLKGKRCLHQQHHQHRTTPLSLPPSLHPPSHDTLDTSQQIMAGLPPIYNAENLREAHAHTFKSLGNKLQAPFLKALDNMGYE